MSARRLRRPASLRGRVVLGVLALLLVLLAALFSVVDVLLTSKLHSDLRTRLTDRVALAEQLDGAMSAQQLVNRLRGDGVTAQLCGTDSCVNADSAPPPPARGAPSGRPAPGNRSAVVPVPRQAAKAKATVHDAGPLLYVRTTLPSSKQVLTLSVDSSQVGAAVHRLIVLEIVGGLIALGLAALLLGRVVGSALRPLDDMTSLARQIADGDRGRRLGADGTARANTELGRTAVAFDAMLDALESALATASEAEARLREFLSDVSHELRTPLTGVQATTEMLLRAEPDHAGRERAYVTLVRETLRANRLVEDLLTVTRLDTGMHLSAGAVDVGEVVRQEVTRVVTLSPTRVELTERAVAVVQGDAVRIGQVIANVLGNARTAAGPDGAVWVDVDVAAGCVQVDVTDSGAGVADADRERIFERLVRLDESRARDRGGFGLGLPIARALARAHGGDLSCLPARPGHGATFRFTLPAHAADVDRSAQSAQPAQPAHPAQSTLARIVSD